MSYQIYSSITATIANGQTTSGEIDTRGLQVIGIKFPASMTGATVAFHRSPTSGGTFEPVREVDNAGAFNLPVTSSSYIPLRAERLLGVQFLKIVSASAETGAKTIELVCAPVTGY